MGKEEKNIESVIDTRGHLCPMPLILTKKALKSTDQHVGLQILTDNEISKNNLLSFLENNSYLTNCQYIDNNHWCISIVNDKEDITIPVPNTPINKIKKNHILILNRDKMGSGSDELGEILIKGFLNALNELDELPEKIIFYNSGVLLSINSYPEIESLKKLQSKGVDLILCGACIDYFQIKGSIAVGRISNMLSICEIINSSEKIIYV